MNNKEMTLEEAIQIVTPLAENKDNSDLTDDERKAISLVLEEMYSCQNQLEAIAEDAAGEDI